MKQDEKLLRAYIYKILELQHESRERNTLTEEELKRIAEDMGMSGEDWQYVLHTLEGHIKRGIGHNRYGNSDEAIEEFRQAITLNPHHIKALEGLGVAYYNRWVRDRNQEDYVQAEYYAKRCLEVEPEHEGSLRLLSELRKSKSVRKADGAQRMMLTAVSLVLVCILMAGSIVLFSVYDSTPVSRPGTEQTSSQKRNLSAGEIFEAVTDFKSHEEELNVEFVSGKAGHDLDIQVESSLFRLYRGSFSFDLRAEVIPSDIEVSRLRLKVELFDRDGKIIISDFADVIRNYDPPARSGDVIPFRFLEYRKRPASNVSRAEVSVQMIEKRPSPAWYEASEPVEIEWHCRQPEGMNISVQQRTGSIIKSRLSNDVFHKIVYEAENTGSKSIRHLELSILWENDKGETLETKKMFAVTAPEPKLKIGQKRIMGRTFRLPGMAEKNFKKCRVRVTGIE